ERLGVGPGDSFLLTLTLRDTVPLGEFLDASLPNLDRCRCHRLRKCLAVALGRFLARMHDAGVLHNDLHAGNLLVRWGDDDRPELFLIALHAVQLRGRLGWTASRDNLVALNRWFSQRASRSDRLRFWREYCRCRQAPPSDNAMQRRRKDDDRALEL